MATLAVSSISRNGVDVTAAAMVAATSGGDAFTTSGQEYLVVNNGDASSHTVQFLFGPGSAQDGVTPTAPTHPVPAGKYYIFGPFDIARYADANGLVQVRYDAVTSVKVAVVKGVSVGSG
jgi:hypothetical protein